MGTLSARRSHSPTSFPAACGRDRQLGEQVTPRSPPLISDWVLTIAPMCFMCQVLAHGVFHGNASSPRHNFCLEQFVPSNTLRLDTARTGMSTCLCVHGVLES